MLQIDNTIISLDVLEKEFICDISICKGDCCVQGDSGAPLEDDEILYLEENYEKIKPYLTEKGKKAIKKHGVWFTDSEGEKVTTLINNKECAFIVFDNEIAKCGIELTHNNGDIDFLKPISCHLYPIRVKEYSDFSAVNYNTWDICASAVRFGKFKGVKVYEFLKEPLIRKFGEQWYKDLCIAAEHLRNKNEE
jgi:hypothetical protein